MEIDGLRIELRRTARGRGLHVELARTCAIRQRLAPADLEALIRELQKELATWRREDTPQEGGSPSKVFFVTTGETANVVPVEIVTEDGPGVVRVTEVAEPGPGVVPVREKAESPRVPVLKV